MSFSARKINFPIDGTYSQTGALVSDGLYENCQVRSKNFLPYFQKAEYVVSKGESSKDEERQLVRKRQELLGSALKKMYDSVLNEPIPDDLLVLLDKIEEKAKESDENEPGGNSSKKGPR